MLTLPTPAGAGTPAAVGPTGNGIRVAVGPARSSLLPCLAPGGDTRLSVGQPSDSARSTHGRRGGGGHSLLGGWGRLRSKGRTAVVTALHSWVGYVEKMLEPAFHSQLDLGPGLHLPP